MPIFKNVKKGEHDNITIVQFGTGDIEISNGFEQDNPEIKVLALGQSKPRPIEAYNDEVPTKDGTTDGLDNPVLLQFSNTESIDVIIDRLNRIKKDLQNDKN